MPIFLVHFTSSRVILAFTASEADLFVERENDRALKLDLKLRYHDFSGEDVFSSRNPGTGSFCVLSIW